VSSKINVSNQINLLPNILNLNILNIYLTVITMGYYLQGRSYPVYGI